MKGEHSAWSLPGLSAWVDRVASALMDKGIALVSADAATPGRMEDAIFGGTDRLSPHDLDRLDGKPTRIIARRISAEPKLEGLMAEIFTGTCVLVRFSSLPAHSWRGWETFLSRFAEQRMPRESGLHILVPDLPRDIKVSEVETFPSWRNSLTRGDRIIWAQEHLFGNRGGAGEDLAVSLATEVCRRRLDLARDLARAGVDDLSDPLAWLDRRARDPDMTPAGEVGKVDSCPLALMRHGATDELRARIWRAQLTSLFPLLEVERQRFVQRFRDLLYVNNFTRGLGVSSVDELEFGALNRQISDKLSEKDANRLAAMTRIRNALAHRKPAEPEDVRHLLRHISSRAA